MFQQLTFDIFFALGSMISLHVDLFIFFKGSAWSLFRMGQYREAEQLGHEIMELINERNSLKRTGSNTARVLINFKQSIYLKKKKIRITVFLSCHIRVQSESTICNCLNIKELLARNRHDISSDSNGTRTYNHFVFVASSPVGVT